MNNNLLKRGSIINVILNNSVRVGGFEYQGIEVTPSAVLRESPVMVLKAINEGQEDEKIPLNKINYIDILAAPVEGLED